MSAVFIFTLGFGIIIPVIPYYTQSVGATAFHLGLLLATFSFLQFICGPFWGRISDQIGRKPVILCTLTGFAIAFTIIGFSQYLWMLFIAVAIAGFFSGGIFPAAMAYIADITRTGERARMMGLMGAVSGLGFILGPFISSFLSLFGLSIPFFTAAVLSAITAIGFTILIPESISKEKKFRIVDAIRPGSILHTIVDTSKIMTSAIETPAGIYLIAMLVISYAISGFEGTFTYYLMKSFGLTSATSSVPLFNGRIAVTGPTAMGVVFALMGAISVVCQGLIVGRAIEKFGEVIVIAIGLLFGTVGLILILTATDLGAAIGYICIVSVGSGLVFPCLNTVISHLTDDRHQGVILGIMGSYGSLGRVLGPPIAGYLFVANIALPYLISSAVMMLCAIWILAMFYYDRKNHKVEGLKPDNIVKVPNKQR
ncbi:MAG TPA: MFS transporter [Methanocella sp.]|nr:MFS transporter [Methanocella sp.]